MIPASHLIWLPKPFEKERSKPNKVKCLNKLLIVYLLVLGCRIQFLVAKIKFFVGKAKQSIKKHINIWIIEKLCLSLQMQIDLKL
jgi:hypothetical protein